MASSLKTFVFPDLCPEISEKLFQNDRQMVVIGVIGKSSSFDANKMIGFKILDYHPAFDKSEPREGRIRFYFEENGNIMYVHFETTYDNHVLMNVLIENSHMDHFITFNSYIRTRFARMLLFAIQICHIIVLVEPATSFDASYLSIFKSLKIIREKYVLKFLPKLIKNSNSASFMGKEGRLCSPRFIFYFEGPIDYAEELKRLEFAVEDDIYKMLRNEFIITNNTSMSLFSIPRNKRFVYFNTDGSILKDPLTESIEMLMGYLDRPEENDDEDLDTLMPYHAFGKPWYLEPMRSKKNINKERSLVSLLKEHVEEAFGQGFDDSMSKFRGKSHFVIPSAKTWYEAFKVMHKIFIENPDNPEFEANDHDYKAYLENFHKIMDIDESFFAEICEHGFELAVVNYKEMLPHHYSRSYHDQKYQQAYELFQRYAKGPQKDIYEAKLKDYCDSTWMNGKQKCEYPSLKGNPCALAKHKVNDPMEHSSNVVYVSSCNCGKTQGHREDPYSIRQANYDFYQILAKSCPNCTKLEKINFPIFEPSGNDFRAAEFMNKNISSLMSFEHSAKTPDAQPPLSIDHSPHLSGSQKSQNSSNLSFDGVDDDDKEDEDDDEWSDEQAEIVIKVGEHLIDDKEKLLRQASTTEYLPGMLHTKSPSGLLPQFPSWSLVCIGPSSIYSHNTGLPEHVQSGFLSGANFLLPWDVNVRLENAKSWAASYEKIRNRKKTLAKSGDMNNNFNLKIFLGCEYECLRGHRFILSSPNTVLRGGSGITKDSGSKIVFNDMPLYFPCPCRTSTPNVSQLMRVHVVTPKAPVTVTIDPRVKINNDSTNSIIFTTGGGEPIKLSQSTYWILRLPFIYEGDDGPILPPLEVNPNSAAVHGCLLAGMYGIKENELADDQY